MARAGWDGRLLEFLSRHGRASRGDVMGACAGGRPPRRRFRRRTYGFRRWIRAPGGTASTYQVSRNANCMTRAALPEFRVLKKPVPATAVGLFGLLNTLKKSILNRTV